MESLKHLTVRLLHGTVTGAAICGVLGMVEAMIALVQHPFHRDPSILARMLWSDLKLGAALGLLAAVSLPLFCRRRDRRFPGLQIALLVIGLLGGLLVGINQSGGWPIRTAWALGVMLVLQQSGRSFTRTRFGWMSASFFTPLSSSFTVLVVIALSAASLLLPVIPNQLQLAGEISESKLDVSTLTAIIAANRREETEAPRNLLLINLPLCDYQRLSCGGYIRATSPGIDRLANEGLQLSQMRAELAGTPASDTAAMDFNQQLAMMATRLTSQGWRTSGLCAGRGAPSNPQISRGFQRFNDLERLSMRQASIASKVLRKYYRLPKPTPSTRQIVNHLLNQMNEARANNQRNFSYLELDHAWRPLNPEADLKNKFMPEGLRAADAFADPPNPEAQRSLRDAQTLAMDRTVSAVISSLIEQDLLEDTLVVICASSLSNPQLSPPLILRHSRSLPAGGKADSKGDMSGLPGALLAVLGGTDGLLQSARD